MSALTDALAQIADHLQQLEVPWALVGGLAVGVHAEPRTTRDVDCAISVSRDKDADRVILALHGLGYRDLADGAVLVGPVTGDLQAVRLVPPGETMEGVVVDILHRICGIEPEIVEAAEEIEILSGLVVPVVSRAHLMAMKVVAWRPRDQEDIRVLLQRASVQDLRETTDALDLIARRPSLDRQLGAGESLAERFQSLLGDTGKRAPDQRPD